LAENEALAATPGFWNDQLKAKSVIEKTNLLKAVLVPFQALEKSVEDAEVLAELLAAASNPEAQARELEDHVAAAERAFRRFELQSLLSDPLDSHNAYLSLHAGAGGTESCDWADMLFRMYSRYAEQRGFTVDVMDCKPGTEAGLQSISFLVSGPFAYGYMKAERGVHRLVRISPFDANKRRHTSFVALDVVAEVEDDVEIEINENDLKIDTFRAGGAGGQKVNKTDSAVRITHLPTGVVVGCQIERSQHANRNKAMKMLRAKLYEIEQDKKRKEQEKHYSEKGDIAWGHQIRSYVLQPYTLCKDLRTDIEVGNVAGVLDGDLDPFIESYLKYIQKQNAKPA